MGKTFKDRRDGRRKSKGKPMNKRPLPPGAARRRHQPRSFDRLEGTMPSEEVERASYECIGPGSARGLGSDTTTMRVGPPAIELDVDWNDHIDRVRPAIKKLDRQAAESMARAPLIPVN